MADLIPLSGPIEMLDEMPSEFVGKSNLEKLWGRLGAPLTDVEDTLYWLQFAFSLDDGAGVQLDAVGDLVNQPRDGGRYPAGESDTNYRVKLRAAILRNRSMGTAEQLRAMAHALLTGKVSNVQIIDVPQAAFVLVVLVTAALTAGEEAALISFCNAARGAGIGIAGLAWYIAPTFAFDGFPDPPFKGYDDRTGLVGGYWAKYIWP